MSIRSLRQLVVMREQSVVAIKLPVGQVISHIQVRDPAFDTHTDDFDHYVDVRIGLERIERH